MTHQPRNRIALPATLLLAAIPHLTPPAMGAVTTLHPMVVTANRADGTISQYDLDLFQAQSTGDLSGLAPGLSVITSDTRGYGDMISMRGNSNTLYFSPPAVGMVVDDVPMGDVFCYPSGLLEIDRISILRGPQSTIYGRNGAAGMLDMSTPQPGTTLGGRFETTLGSYDSFDARLRTGGPIAPELSHTLQLYHQQRDGYIDNTTLGRATDDRSVDGGMLNLFWNPSPDNEWRLRVMAEEADDGSQRLSRLDSPDPYKVQSEIPGESETSRLQLSLHGTWNEPWGRLKSITSWQTWNLDHGVTDLDLTASPPGLESSSTINQDQELRTQEFRWESPADAAPWSWRTGVFFMDQATGGDTIRTFPIPPAYVPYAEQTRFQIDQWNIAAYGRANYAVNSRWSLLAGARLEYVETEIDSTKTAASPVIPPALLPPTAVVRDSMAHWYLSPELGVTYNPCDTVRWFARSAVGIKPAGYSAFASTVSTSSYADETTLTNELGVAVSFPDENLNCSLTGFYNRSRDYQVNRPDLYSTDFFTVNAERVTSMGVEIELGWQPVKGLTLQGNAGLIDSRFDSYQDPLLAGTDYHGKTVPFVPEFTGCIGARYDFPNGIFLQTALRMTGSTYYDEANRSDFRQGTYGCWNAEIGYAVDRFSASLFVRNLTDENYYNFISPQINAGSPAEPRVFGVRAMLAF